MNGFIDGFVVGLIVGFFDGPADGLFVGILDGAADGLAVGLAEGLEVEADGHEVVGFTDGAADEVVGFIDGTADGNVGMADDGAADGQVLEVVFRKKGEFDETVDGNSC